MFADLHLGSVTISWLPGGSFALDGGTMFGPVPRQLWAKKIPPDADNCIPLINAPLLIQAPGTLALIDTGLGNRLTTKQRQIYRVTSSWDLPRALEKRGFSRHDIDLVILTHGDFDHAGGLVLTTEQGATELTFPRARHIIQKQEWEDICHPNLRASHAYWSENFTGLSDAGLLELVEGDLALTPELTVRRTGGHTRGHQLVACRGTDGCVVHLGDVFPTHAHINPLWIMAYDNFPLDLIEVKQHLLPAYREQGCWFSFYHDPAMAACRLDDQLEIKETHA